MKVFCDMDGVLDDFVTGACLAHNRPNPYQKAESLGCFDIELLLGMSPAEFWEPLRGYDFWMNLNKTAEADRIIGLLSETFGANNIAILTAPPSEDSECIRAKRDWITKYYPSFSKRMIFTSAKEFLSGEGHVLVDDRDRNLQDFSAGGGAVIPIPRPWNMYHDLTPLHLLEAYLLEQKPFVWRRGSRHT